MSTSHLCKRARQRVALPSQHQFPLPPGEEPDEGGEDQAIDRLVRCGALMTGAARWPVCRWRAGIPR
jgi:hypothetical protein